MAVYEKNLFSILGIDVDADDKQIRNAYRKLAKKFHPDVNPGNPSADEAFKTVSHAYWILSDPRRRKEYIRTNPFIQPKPPRRSSSFQETFKKAKAKEATRARPHEGKDIVLRLYLSLEEIVEGASKRIKIKRWISCKSCDATGIYGGAKAGVCATCKGTGILPDFTRGGKAQTAITCRKCGGSGLQPMSACHECGGKGRVSREVSLSVGVPPGTVDGETITVKSQGHEGTLGGETGDLKVIVKQREHAYLERRGYDLYYHCSISLTQWIQGCELNIPGLKGPLSLTLKPGSAPEGTLKIRDRGLPRPNGRKGDLIVRYSLCVPEKLTVKQKLLMKALEGSKGFAPEVDTKGWCLRSAKEKQNPS